MKTGQFSGNVEGQGVTHDTLTPTLPLRCGHILGEMTPYCYSRICAEHRQAGAVIWSLFRNKGPARQTQSHYRLERSSVVGGAEAIAAEGGDGYASIAF